MNANYHEYLLLIISLRLILCLLYEPHLIAAGCLLLAYRLNNKQLPVDGDFGKMMEDNYEALQGKKRIIEE